MKTIVSKLQLLIMAILVCSLAWGGLVHPQQVSALVCTDNGLPCDIGYFSGQAVTGAQHNLYYGNDYSWGGSPFLLGLRPNNVWDLKALIGNRMACTNGANSPTVLPNPGSQNSTAAAFTVLTMLGAPPGTPKNVACERFLEWAALMDAYDAAGLIHYSEWYSPNGVNTRLSFNQGTDVSYYTDWSPPSAPSVVFYDPNGSGPLYAIKRDCGNPLGKLRALTWDYDLHPQITATDSSGATITGAVEPGETITFRYYIRNNGGTASQVVNCYGGKLPHAGYFPTPPTPETGGSPVALGCPRNFPAGSANVLVGGPESVTATANTTICRTLFVNPSTPGGGPRGTEICVAVASRPYVMSFGGDIKTGGGPETAPDTCSQDTQASLSSWNKNSAASGWSGAGTQYAAMATGILRAFATAQHGPAGGANAPAGLAFASTTQNLGVSTYGGSFGPTPCIKDYYSQKPAVTSTPPPNVSSMVTGDYASNTSMVLSGGIVNPGQKITLYVDGDLFINSSIRYTNNISYSQIPMLKVVVRGSIFIGNNVDRIDGTFIAQPRPDGSQGYVYTCATDSTPPFTPLTITAGSFYNDCDNTKLQVNGSIVARHIQFLRTKGTLRDSSGSESRLSNSAAEQFNYGPAAWITQPTNTGAQNGQVEDYDAITSLPPVL